MFTLLLIFGFLLACGVLGEDVRVRKNGADSGIAITVVAAGRYTDSTNTATYTATDEFNYDANTAASGPPTAGNMFLTCVGCLVENTEATTAIKTVNGLAKASVKAVNGLAIASVKTMNGLP